MKHTFKITLLLVTLLLVYLHLEGATPREQDDYAYIIELYDMGEHLEALFEMDYFVGNYPNSEFIPYLDYIRANIALKNGETARAIELYARLTGLPLHKDVMADILLNYAIALHDSGEYQDAIRQLLDLGRLTDHPYYVYHGNIWRGRCYQAMGLLLSAEHEYSKSLALDASDKELEFDYVKLLLLLKREETARSIIDTRAADPFYGPRYRLEWLQYLLYDQRFEDFDLFVSGIKDSLELQSDEVRLILVRKDMAVGNTLEAESRLSGMNSGSAHVMYYQALIKLSHGEEAQADSIFRALVKGNNPEIQFLAYLEHLKLVHRKDPGQARQLLGKYLERPLPQNYRGQQYILMASFEYEGSNYSEALRLWTIAKQHELPPDLLDVAEIGIADSYYRMGQLQLAIDNYNKYLNNLQNGRYRDKAFFWLGKINQENNDLSAARSNLEALITRYPISVFRDDALFLLGENFYARSDYARAVEYYSLISQDHASRRSVALRIAQCYYYLDRFSDSEAMLMSIGTLFRDFETVLLEASLTFNRREFNAALGLYKEAWSLSQNEFQKQEAASYQAYCLYFLKRFDEASALFLELSDLNPDVDSYLLQAARSAYQGRSYKRAMELYDRFVDTYPDSPHFLGVLTQIAQCYYNLGNPEQAYADWLNILARFRNSVSFSPEEVTLMNEVFNGIQLSLDSMDDITPINQLIEMLDSFQSEYIRFEISYLIVRLYADSGQWQEVFEEAEEIRRSFPDQKKPDLDLLLAESLSRLNQQSKAEEIATQVFEQTQSPESLLSLARLAESTGDLASAQQKYRELFDLQPSASTWLSMLDLSQKNAYQEYDDIWDLGKEYAMDYPQARINRIKYLSSKGFYDEAAMMANKILDTETNQYIRGQADRELAMIWYLQKDYQRSASAFKRIRVLFRDYPDIKTDAQFYYILSLISNGALKEAQLTLWEVQSQLTDDQVIIINDLLDQQR